MSDMPVFLRNHQILGTEAQFSFLGVAAFLKPAFVLTAPWEVRLGCDLPTPYMAFTGKTQTNFWFKTFLRIMLILQFSYCSHTAGGAEFLGAQGTLHLGDQGC